MIFEKATLYDWGGANDWLFKAINGIHGGDSYQKVMILLSRLADYHNFPYYLYVLVVWTFGGYLLRKAASHGGARTHLVLWFGVLSVLVGGFAAEAVMIRTLKAEFSYPRPYIVYPADAIHIQDYEYKPGNDHHSFPSGHASFITLLVVALWPALTGGLRWLGVLLIPAVCWSRIALGMHFPADVLAGFLMTLVLVLIVRGVLYSLMRKYFGLRC